MCAVNHQACSHIFSIPANHVIMAFVVLLNRARTLGTHATLDADLASMTYCYDGDDGSGRSLVAASGGWVARLSLLGRRGSRSGLQSLI